MMKQGRRFRDSYFTVFARPNASLLARLGLAVSRKAAPRAVDRNRIRRHVRESFRHHQQDLAGIDLVVMAQAEARRADAGALRAALSGHWRRVVASCKPSSSA